MESKVSFFNELSGQADMQMLFEKVLLQLEKDFRLFGLALFEENKTLNAENLAGRVAVLIGKIEKQTGNQLNSLLYQVDVKQQLVSHGMELPAEKRHAFLAEAVLNRTLKKVITKLHYSS